MGDLSRYTEQVTNYCNKWRIKLSESKTQLLVIANSPRPVTFIYGRHIDDRVKINGQSINLVVDAQFLGVRFDHMARFHKHVKATATKARRRVILIRRLGGSNLGLDGGTRRQLRDDNP